MKKPNGVVSPSPFPNPLTLFIKSLFFKKDEDTKRKEEIKKKIEEKKNKVLYY